MGRERDIADIRDMSPSDRSRYSMWFEEIQRMNDLLKEVQLSMIRLRNHPRLFFELYYLSKEVYRIVMQVCNVNECKDIDTAFSDYLENIKKVKPTLDLCVLDPATLVPNQTQEEFVNGERFTNLYNEIDSLLNVIFKLKQRANLGFTLVEKEPEPIERLQDALLGEDADEYRRQLKEKEEAKNG